MTLFRVPSPAYDPPISQSAAARLDYRILHESLGARFGVGPDGRRGWWARGEYLGPRATMALDEAKARGWEG